MKEKLKHTHMRAPFPHLKLFSIFLSRLKETSSCLHSQEIKHLYGQDRKIYYTVCFTSIALTHGLMRPNSPHLSDGPIMMEIVTHIIMCKLMKGFHCAAPSITSDR